MSAVARSETRVTPAAEGAGAIVPRPELLQRLRRPGRVTLLSAPAGSGKTVLLRSWLGETAVADSVAWLAIGPKERDPQRFWFSLLDALRDTCAGAALGQALSAAPGLDGWEIVERLLEDLDSLEGRLWLVIDDLQELRSDEALRQLELLVMRAPADLRFLLASRHDPRLGLHRLRLEGELTEIRADDLRFTLAQARQLLDAAGVELPDPALALLYERTEGWAAGLRLAALSLAVHPDPERFGSEFSGGERTVAEYLLAEVLERQPEAVRQLLLRTSVLERINGSLADHLTGGHGAEQVFHQLAAANAFVVALDANRLWFRYHRLFADLLALELRRTAPGEVAALHRAAAAWFAEHDFPVEAVRHAQAAKDWRLAAALLSDHWFRLELTGQATTAHDLLSRFPPGVAAGDPELVALAGADELHAGSLERAERHLGWAMSELPAVPAERRGHLQVTLGMARLGLARQRADVAAVAEEAQRLLAPAEVPQAMIDERRALALISRGIAETWSARNVAAERDLERGVALSRRIERPYLELLGLAHAAHAAVAHSYKLAVRRSREAIELAERHNWSDVPVAGIAYAQLAWALLVQGQLDEADQWLERAERTLRTDVEPAAGISLHWTRGDLELARGRPARALDAYRASERLAGLLLTPHVDACLIEARVLQARIRLGRRSAVELALAGMDESRGGATCMRNVIAELRLADGDPAAATVALAPAIEGDVPADRGVSLLEALLLEAIARDALGETPAVHRAIERALDLAEPDGMLLPFLLHPVGELLERHSQNRTSHASLLGEILDQLVGRAARRPLRDADRLCEQLSDSEARVLRYLPTNLSLREIASELYVSVHTIKTHTKHIYAKLNAHGRAEAVARARSLGLLAPSSRGRHTVAASQ